MTRKEFETTDEPLCMIVSVNPDSGEVMYDTYDWKVQKLWLDEFEEDFPNMMHFSKLNPAAINARRKMFGLEEK